MEKLMGLEGTKIDIMPQVDRYVFPDDLCDRVDFRADLAD